MYLLTVTLAKVFNFFIRTLHLGAGYTWPGHLALKLYPSLLKDTRLFPKQLVYISATNGKTTTAKLISHILRKDSKRVASNISGANLLNGIATALMLHTNLLGNSLADYGIFEVDEFVLPNLLALHVPAVLVLLNLSRDQLDRYGETDIIFERWTNALSKLDTPLTLLLDADQVIFKPLYSSKHNVILFDGKALTVTGVDEGITETIKSNMRDSGIPLQNVNAALLAVTALNGDSKRAVTYLKDFSSAWGRGETFSYDNVTWKIYLAKNPMSFLTNLNTLLDTKVSDSALLFILNDNIPDGRDVSWIYDIPAEPLARVCGSNLVFVAGIRAYDMAVRLHYAGVEVSADNIISDIKKAVALINASHKSNVVVLPNYSAMLEFRKVILGRSIL